ncbi:phage tail protein [Pseudogemmobacter faecipullorum]|uniref:phage tail protein n=1 Tax=Pseudogemmobacter faecipullorum TaxID=2755041 RepID=UPI001D00FD39|nr:phage tail protein [Pseudogemmobacter faecipullorum]
MTMVVECSSLPQGLSGVWVGDDRGEFAPGINGYIRGAQAPRDTGAIWENPANPAGFIQIGASMNNHIDDTDSGQRRMWLKWVDGTQAAADPFLMWAFESDPDYPWTSAMVGKGKAYAIITCQYDHESMLQYPEFLFELEPLPLYDPRLDSTAGGLGAHRWGQRSTYAPSDNLAVMAYNVARGIYYGDEWLFGGQNLDAWRLPFDEWVAAMNACDEQIERADGSFERAFRGGAEISVEMEPLGVMEELGRAANMRFAEVGGRLKPICGLPGASVFSITDEDIIITEGQSYQPFLGLSATYNALTATYPEPGEKWASKDAPEFIDTVATAADDARYLPVGVSYPAAPHANQVQRLMRAQMQDYRRMRVHQLSLPPDAYGLEPLVDMISWTSARNGYDAKRFLVMSVAKMPGMNVAVTLREVDPGDYDWQPGFELPYTIVPPVNVLPFVQRIASFSAAGAVLEDSSGRGRKAAIVVGCGGDEAGVTQIRIQILKGAEAVFDVSRPYGAPYSWTISDVTPDTAYTVRACLISELTGKTEWSPDILVTTPSIEITDADLDPALRDSISDLIGFGEALTGPDGIEATLIRAKNEALAAEVGAATHAAVALAAQGEVEAAVSDAEAAVEAAQASAASALASLQSAQAEADEAAAAAISAATAVTSAQTAAASSASARDASVAAKTAAETARTQAQTAATNAGNSASAAAGSATTAGTKATEAGQSASAAAASAVTANTKANEAGQSAQAAATSESSAATFAGDAEDSATAAASSAVTANTKAGEAAGSASAAATSAATATTKANEAGQSATTAQTQAQTATTKAGEASTSATNAATSASNASGSANAASSSASTSATALSDVQRALASTTAIVNGRASAATLPYSGAVTGLPDDVVPWAANNYASDADGVHLLRSSPVNSVSHLRALVPCNNDAVYRVTAKVKSNVAMSVALRNAWIMQDGSVRTNGNYVITPLAANTLTTLTMVFGRVAGGLVTVVGGDYTHWNLASFFRFGVINTTTGTGAILKLYDITVEDLTAADQAARQAGLAAGSASAAATSASNAAASSTTAGQQASAATTAKTAAETAKGAAEVARNEAVIAKNDAQGAATTATTQAGLAATSRDAAAGSATAAASSASTATTKATEAATSATTASNQAQTATTKAGEASTSATQAAQSKTDAAGSANAAATSASTSATALSEAQRALASGNVVVAGKASTATLPYGQLAVGLPDAYFVRPASEYGSDADGVHLNRDAAGSGNACLLRTLVPSEDGKVYRLTARVKATAAFPVAMYIAWLKADGSLVTAGTFQSQTVAAGTVTTISMVFGRNAGGLVAQTAGTAANWTEAAGLRLGVSKSGTHAAGTLLKVYDIQVEDLTAADQAARQAGLAAGSATAAATSASNAAASSTTAGQQATAATNAKTAAETARGQAQTAATNAATSETNAAGSANSAASSATTSASSRDAAAGSATAAAGSASLASTKATEAGNSATAANSAKTAAETARGQAQAAATSAATSETNAAGSANTASTHATAAAKSFLNTVMVEGNPSFDDGFASWRVNTSIPGTDLSAAHGTLASGVFTTTAGARRDVCQRKFHRLDPNRKYRARGRFKVTGGTAQIYMGCQAADGNGAITGGNAGLYYIISGGAQYPASEDWIERSSVVFTLANLKASVTNSTAAEGVYLISLLNYAAAAGVQVALDGIWLEDVTESEATRADASASATSAALASTKATEAGTSATAAQTARTGAETARSGAEAAQTTATTAANTATGAAATATSQATLAASARTGAETARTGAEAAGAAAQAHASAANGAALSASDSAAKSLTYATNAARLMSGGVSKNPIFNLWTGTYPDHVAVTPYAGNTVTKNTANARYQNALQVVCGGTADGPLIRIDQAGQALDCSKSPRGVKIRMEIEFLSGNLANSGALLRAIWLDSGTRTEYVNLKDYMTAITGVVQVVEVYFARPAAAVPASATNFILDLFASSMLGGTRAAWQFRVHRLDFEEVLANSETAIIQQAIADVTGIKAAAIGLRATAGSAGAYLELVALDDPNGPASMARIAADLLLLEGTIRGDHMELKSLRTEHLDVPFLNGERIRAEFLDVDSLLTIQTGAGLRYQKATVNSDATDGLYFGHDGGRFGFAASRTSANKRQSLKLSQTTGLQLLNARHFVTGASLPQTAQHTASLSKTALPAGIKEISLEVQGAGGAGEGLEAVGAGSTTTTPRHIGGNGGATIVRLYDGATLKQTITAAGGNGGGVTTPSPTQQEGKGKDSSYAPGGAMQTSDRISALRAGYPGSRGSGASGAFRHYVIRSGGSEGTTRDYYVYGRGGAAGQLVTTEVIDLSGYAAPFIEIVIGNGGVPAAPTELGKGGRGGAGEVNYVYSVTMNLPADVVPLVPTATGVIQKVGLNVPFPDLGAGHWTLSIDGEANMDVGRLQVGPDEFVFIRTGTSSFYSSQTPVRASGGWSNNKTIHYTFRSMGSWG